MKNVIEIETINRLGKTVLRKGYAAHPYKLADITGKQDTANMQLMLRSSSPGILDGDHYQFSIHIGTGSSLSLASQSYQRLFSMKTGASQHMTVAVGKGASFHYIPHPLVPQAKSIFTSKNNISLEPGAKLTWGEVITCGRKLNGEAFLFHSFQNLTEIYLNQKLLLRDNLIMRPAAATVAGIGQLEGYTHQASLVMIDDAMEMNCLVTFIHHSLSEEKGICFGVSALATNAVIVRMLGDKAEKLYQLLQSIISGCQRVVHAKAGNAAEVFNVNNLPVINE